MSELDKMTDAGLFALQAKYERLLRDNALLNDRLIDQREQLSELRARQRLFVEAHVNVCPQCKVISKEGVNASDPPEKHGDG